MYIFKHNNGFYSGQLPRCRCFWKTKKTRSDRQRWPSVNKRGPNSGRSQSRIESDISARTTRPVASGPAARRGLGRRGRRRRRRRRVRVGGWAGGGAGADGAAGAGGGGRGRGVLAGGVATRAPAARAVAAPAGLPQPAVPALSALQLVLAPLLRRRRAVSAPSFLLT